MLTHDVAERERRRACGGGDDGGNEFGHRGADATMLGRDSFRHAVGAGDADGAIDEQLAAEDDDARPPSAMIRDRAAPAAPPNSLLLPDGGSGHRGVRLASAFSNADVWPSRWQLELFLGDRHR